MIDDELRLECLKIAMTCSDSISASDDALHRAQKLFDFLKRNCPVYG